MRMNKPFWGQWGSKRTKDFNGIFRTQKMRRNIFLTKLCLLNSVTRQTTCIVCNTLSKRDELKDQVYPLGTAKFSCDIASGILRVLISNLDFIQWALISIFYFALEFLHIHEFREGRNRRQSYRSMWLIRTRTNLLRVADIKFFWSLQIGPPQLSTHRQMMEEKNWIANGEKDDELKLENLFLVVHDRQHQMPKNT